MDSSTSIAAYFPSAFVIWVLEKSQQFSMTSRRVSALRAGSQMLQTDGEICCIVGMPLLSQTLHHLCAWLEAAALSQSPSFLQIGKHLGEAARDCLSGEGCAELNHLKCYWQSSTLCLISLGALGFSGHRTVQKGGSNVDSALCPANMTGATLSCWALDGAQIILWSIQSRIPTYQGAPAWNLDLHPCLETGHPSRSNLGHASVLRLITQGYRLWKRISTAVLSSLLTVL